VAGKVLDQKAAKAVAQATMFVMAENMSHEHMMDNVYPHAVYRYIKLWGEAKGTAEERFSHADKHIFSFKPHTNWEQEMLAVQGELSKTAIPEAQGYIREGLKNPYYKS